MQKAESRRKRGKILQRAVIIYLKTRSSENPLRQLRMWIEVLSVKFWDGLLDFKFTFVLLF
jgi:hypothetical protein